MLLACSLAWPAAIAACASIPPHAAEHARDLGDFHDRSARAALAAFDLLAATLNHALDRVRATADADWTNYADDAADAARRFDRLRAAAHDALALAADPDLRLRLAALRDDAAAAAAAFDSHARTAALTRAADLAALVDFQRAADRAAAALRQDTADALAVVSRELDRQAELLDAANAVADSRRALLGQAAIARADRLRERAERLVAPVADAASRLDAALKALTRPAPARP
jgi:hypothetical protein